MRDIALLIAVWICGYQTIEKVLVPIWARQEWKRANGHH